jgi:hypothetical protein
MEIPAWSGLGPELELGIELGIEPGLVLASECLPVAEVAGTARPIAERPPCWSSTLGQFWRAPGKPVFWPSGKRKPTRPERRASRSALGVLQLAYFSTRYGLVPGLNSAEFYRKSYPAARLGSTPKRNPYGYFRHRSGPLAPGSRVRRASNRDARSGSLS